MEGPARAIWRLPKQERACTDCVHPGILGLNEQIKKTADRSPKPATGRLCRTYIAAKCQASDEASHMMANLNFPDAAEQDIRGAVRYLKQSSERVAVVASAWAAR